MKIDLAVNSNYPELIEIWEASVRFSHDFLTESDILYYRKRILEEYFDHVELFASKNQQEKITGFLGISTDKIEMLFVHPDYMNKGIGKLLLNFAITSKGLSKVDVNEQNHRAVSFYKSMGFQILRRNELDPEGRPFPILELELK